MHALHMATATGGDWRHQPMRDDRMTWRENVLAAAAAATIAAVIGARTGTRDMVYLASRRGVA